MNRPSAVRPPRRVLPWLLLAVALGAVAATGCARHRDTDIASVAWLNGCWQGKSEEGRVDLQWGKPAGGSLLGAGRVVRGDRTAFAEFLELRESVDGLLLVVHPLGQPPVTYRLQEAGRNEAVFVNAGQAFPQRITYRRDGATLQVRAEGEPGGNQRQVRYKLSRTPCD
jgi:hypothetical protein